MKKILSKMEIPEDIGLIVRTAGSGARRGSFHDDFQGLLTSWKELQRAIVEKPAPCCLYQEPDLVERVLRDWLTEDIDRIVIDSKEKYERIREIASRISRKARSRITLYEGDLPIFDHYDVERQLEESLRRKVVLKSGGYIVLDETEAMIAVDVNTEAVEEVARQLRLRNIGGLVVLDLIDMKSRKHQSQVFKAMKAALKRDRARTNVLSISELGLMEMTRQRQEESILSTMYSDCPYCRGRGKVKSSLGISVEIQRQLTSLLRRHSRDGQPPELQVVVHPTVMDRLKKEDEEALLDIQGKFEGRLTFKSDPSRHVEFFAINNAATGDVLYSSVDK